MQNELLKKLNQKNYRVTQTRIDILECLNDDLHGHTIKDIVHHLKMKNKKVNVASVYNTIKMLIDEGIVDIYTDYKNKTQIFEIVNNKNLHIHVYVSNTKEVIKIDMPKEVEQAIRKTINKKYNISNIKIEILANSKK